MLERERFEHLCDLAYFGSGEEEIRKETAEKIYRELCEHGTTYVKKWIKEQFSVEIKE